MPVVLQWIQANDRIFNPAAICRASRGLLDLAVMFAGGDIWNITDPAAADSMFENLKAGGGFMEHERTLYNPTAISQVVRDNEKEVSLFYITGGSEIVRKDSEGLYRKWLKYKEWCDQMIQAQQAAIEQQVSGRDRALIQMAKNKLNRGN